MNSINAYTSREQLEAAIDEALAKGEIDKQEAEDIWQDWMHKGNDSYLGVYGW